MNNSCATAFKSGDKVKAEELLGPRVALADVTGFGFAHLHSVATPTDNVSLLHLAAYWGWTDIAAKLVTKYNCPVDRKDDAGRLPLHYAARSGHLEVVKLLVTDLNCDPMERNVHGDTPLHYACKNGHLDIVRYLINEAKCDSLCVNHNDDTPLHCACIGVSGGGHLHPQIVEFLLSTDSVQRNPQIVDAHNKQGHSLRSLQANHSYNYEVHNSEVFEKFQLLIPRP